MAEDGAIHVIGRYRDSDTNLRTTFTKIIKRAGVKVWPKLFHNLRASRETELAATHPIHVVCEWIGNSAAVAAKHYLTVREEDFQRAAQSGAKSGAHGAQNQAQQPSALARTNSQDSPEVDVAYELSRESATRCETSETNEAPRVGLEPTTNRLTAGCSTD